MSMTAEWFDKPEVYSTKFTKLCLEDVKVGNLLRFFLVPDKKVEDQALLPHEDQIDFNNVRLALRLSSVRLGFTHLEDFSAGNFSYRDGYFPLYHLHIRLRRYDVIYKNNYDINRIDFISCGRVFADYDNGEKPFTDRSVENKPLTKEQIIDITKRFNYWMIYFMKYIDDYKKIILQEANNKTKICEFIIKAENKICDISIIN